MDALSLAMPVLALGQNDPADPFGNKIFVPDPIQSPQDMVLRGQMVDKPAATGGGDGAALVAGVSTLALATAAISLISTAFSAYHGYKRNGGSLGWGVWWGIMGSMFGPIPLGIAYAQGFGKRAR